MSTETIPIPVAFKARQQATEARRNWVYREIQRAIEEGFPRAWIPEKRMSKEVMEKLRAHGYSVLRSGAGRSSETRQYKVEWGTD